MEGSGADLMSLLSLSVCLSHRSFIPVFDHSSPTPIKLRYKDRLEKYHAFDGRLINSRVLTKEHPPPDHTVKTVKEEEEPSSAFFLTDQSPNVGDH